MARTKPYDRYEPLMSELSEAIILGAVARPIKLKGGATGFAGISLNVTISNALLHGNEPGLWFTAKAYGTVLGSGGKGEYKSWSAEGPDLDTAIRETIGLVPMSVLEGMGIEYQRPADKYGARSSGKRVVKRRPDPQRPSDGASRRVVKRSKPVEPSTPKRGASKPPSSPSKRVVVRRKG